MAIEITEEMVEGVNTALANRVPCILATAGSDGWPSMGYRGSMMVFDDGSLAFWERSYKDGIAHIKENPQVLVMSAPETPAGLEFYGTHRPRGRRNRERFWDKTVGSRSANADRRSKGSRRRLNRTRRVTNYGGAVMSEK